jgi:hypothetical protein
MHHGCAGGIVNNYFENNLNQELLTASIAVSFGAFEKILQKWGWEQMNHVFPRGILLIEL